MTDAEQREAARQFANKWKGRGREDEDGRSYWIDFLSNVLGMENVTDRVEFEKKVVVDGNTKRIDVYIPETHVLIEQKSLGKALDHKIMNSGSIELTPYDQAKRYNDNLPYDEKARWIITSNFSDIWIYDMNARVPEAVKISLDEIPSKYPLLDILIKKDVQKISHEMEVSIKAGDIVGLLYEAFLTQYKIPEVKAKEETIEQKEKREHKLKSLNALCVRIVFCLYAEDAGIFGKRNIFHDYLKAYEVKDCRRALLELFKVLDLDYVSCWYKKASDYMKENINIRAALVSTNSITQGESVSILWKPLFEDGIQIDYAYRTFIWDSEASIKAHVHCVIIGFSRKNGAEYQKKIYSKDDIIVAKNINGYLLDADNISIEKRMKPLSDVPPISLGGQAIDGGYLILTEEEKEELISKEPQAISFIRHYMMGKDFIDRKPRYCIWLVGADPSLLKRCPLVRERIDKVREFRMASTRNNTRKAADTPGLFASILEYDSPYIAIPKVSSQNRRYIPMDYLDGEIIPGDKLFTMPSATSYEFGILMSNVHMAWTRVVCGRLKSDYSYSNTIVYNNFPWPSPTDEQKEKIKKTAQAILNARALYPNSSLADLYDPLTMPPELLKAHNANNRAVMEAYGFSTKMSEADCVAELMKMYQKLTEEK